MRSQKALISDHEEEGGDEEIKDVEDDVDEERNEEEEKCKEQEVIQSPAPAAIFMQGQRFTTSTPASMRHQWNKCHHITSWSQGFFQQTIEAIYIYIV